jgi:hypothetical protein
MFNHSCRRFVARQTGLAQDLQGVIGLRKIPEIDFSIVSSSLSLEFPLYRIVRRSSAWPPSVSGPGSSQSFRR